MSYLQLTRLPQYTFIVPGPEGERKTKGGRIKEIRKRQRMSEEREKGRSKKEMSVTWAMAGNKSNHINKFMTTNNSLPTAKDSIEGRKTLQGCHIIFTIITIMIMLQENVRFTWQATHESTLRAQIQVLRGNKVTGPSSLKMPTFKTQSSSKDFQKGNIRTLVSIKSIPMYLDQNLDQVLLWNGG